MTDTETQALATAHPLAPSVTRPSLPPVPWRDLQTVSPENRREYIQKLEAACLEHPASADLRTCLGLAYAVNYDVYKSMDALEAAIEMAPTHFWAQLKYAELQYRLRALPFAEKEALKAVELAQNSWQLSLARKQLQEIRSLNRASTRNITLDKPLATPALMLGVMLVVMFVGMSWTW
jgi:tetratricopeptide (TPR) repeat protein